MNKTLYIKAGRKDGLTEQILTKYFGNPVKVKARPNHSFVELDSVTRAKSIVDRGNVVIGRPRLVNWAKNHHKPDLLLRQLQDEDPNMVTIHGWTHHVTEWKQDQLGRRVPYKAWPLPPVVNRNGPYWPWLPIPDTMPEEHPGIDHITGKTRNLMIIIGPKPPQDWSSEPANPWYPHKVWSKNRQAGKNGQQPSGSDQLSPPDTWKNATWRPLNGSGPGRNGPGRNGENPPLQIGILSTVVIGEMPRDDQSQIW